MSDIKYSRGAYIKNKILSKICFWGKRNHYKEKYKLLKKAKKNKNRKIIYDGGNLDISMISDLSAKEQMIYHLLSIYEKHGESNIQIDIKNS